MSFNMTYKNGWPKIKAKLNKFVKEKTVVEVRSSCHDDTHDYYFCVVGVLEKSINRYYTVKGIRRKVSENNYTIHSNGIHITFKKCNCVSNGYGSWQIFI